MTLCLLMLITDAEAVYFRNYSIEQGLPSSEVHQVKQDAEGYLWFATDRGLCRYDGHEFKVYTREDGLSDDVVFGMHLDHNGRMWVFTYTGGLCYYENGRFVEGPYNSELIARLREKDFPPILKMYIDQDENIWIGTLYDQVYRVDKDGEITTPFSTSEGHQMLLWEIDKSNSEGFVYAGGKKAAMGLIPDIIYGDQNGFDSLDISAFNAHVALRYPPRIIRWPKGYLYSYGMVLVHFDSDGVLESINTGSIINWLVRDEEGDLWVGTRDGMLQYVNGDLNSEPRRYLRGSIMSSFMRDEEGGYWFTTLDKGIMYAPNLKVQSYSNDAIGSSRIIQLMSNHKGVYAAGKDGRIFSFPNGDPDQMQVVTIDFVAGRLRYSRKRELVYITNSVKVMLHQPGGDLLHSRLFSFRQDDFNSAFLWREEKMREFVIYNMTSDSSFTLPHPGFNIAALTVTPGDGRVWYGGLTGLFIVDAGRVISAETQFPELGARIADLDVIDSKHLLISTRGSGAFILNYVDNELTRIENIPTKHCHQSIVDSHGDLWLATFSGLYRVLDPVGEARVQRYGHYEGLTSSEVIDVVEYQGKIWVSTGKGISIFDAAWIPPNLEGAPLEVQRMQINHRDTVPQESFVLPYDQNNISLTTNVISYSMPFQYEYKMSGLQEDWIRTDERNINFSELKPGNYSLELRTAVSTGNSDIRKLEFSILPPFWMTIWFGLIAGSFLLLSSLALVNVRYRVIKRENKLYDLFRRSEQKALRSQISPHFLFNAFNSLMELLLNKKHDKVVSYVLNLSKLMRRVLEHTRRENNTLREELDFLRLYVEVESQYISHEFTSEVYVDPDIDVDSTYISSLIVQPYVENALKHGISSRKDGEAALQVGFHADGDKLKVYIQDNGLGYDAAKMQNPKKHRSLGMRINGERFRLFSDDKSYEFVIDTIEKDPGVLYKGTLVKLTFPLQSKHP